jgi:hypothetical protein
MYWLADILLVGFLGLFIYRGIKRGLITSSLAWLGVLLGIALGFGMSFAVVYFLFPLFGWAEDLTFAFYDFALSLMSIVNLIGLDITTMDLANYISIGISTLVLFIPMYALARFFGRQFARFLKWLRSKVLLIKIVGSILGGLVNAAFYGAIVFAAFCVIITLDGYGFLPFTNEVLRSGYITGLVYDLAKEYNILSMLGL